MLSEGKSYLNSFERFENGIIYISKKGTTTYLHTHMNHIINNLITDNHRSKYISDYGCIHKHTWVVRIFTWFYTSHTRMFHVMQYEWMKHIRATLLTHGVNLLRPTPLYPVDPRLLQWVSYRTFYSHEQPRWITSVSSSASLRGLGTFTKNNSYNEPGAISFPSSLAMVWCQ